MWILEVRKYCPTTPYVLVGMKSDLRDEIEQHAKEYNLKGMEQIPSSKGEQVKKMINAQAYIECSARTQYNLQQI
jgi:Ras-related C3 botulinum toxin substrate 1